MKSGVMILGVLWVTAVAASAAKTPGPGKYEWKDTAGQYMDLEFGGKKVLRYMYAHDTSSQEAREKTYKPFYHVYDFNGENLLTKGDGGRYTHHRGIFLGWKNVTFNGRSYDFWHMKEADDGQGKRKGKDEAKGDVKGVDQVHVKVLDKSVTTDGAGLTSRIDWIIKDGSVVIEEARQVTVRKEGDGLVVIDVNTSLKAVSGDVKLDGDPEHAGFQYRASNDVDEGTEADKAKYLYHKAGIAEKGKPSKKGMRFPMNLNLMVDLPWVAMNYGLNGKKYTVQHMNSASNHKPYTYSSGRYYGRFGSFGVSEVKSGDPLKLSWRIIVEQGGFPEREVLQKRYEAYITAQ